jgi:hypothetical protein
MEGGFQVQYFFLGPDPCGWVEVSAYGYMAALGESGAVVAEVGNRESAYFVFIS